MAVLGRERPEESRREVAPAQNSPRCSPKQFVTCGNKIHSRSAPAQSYQVCAQAHLVEVVQIQVAVAQPDAGEHRIILAVRAVCRDVQQSGLRALLTKDFRGGLFSNEEVRARQQGCDRLDLGKNLGSAFVGDSKNEGGALFTRSLCWQRANTVALGA